MLSYGVPADFMDQYIRIGESIVIESLRRFIIAVIDVFGEEYLRSPNENDTSRLLAIRQRRAFLKCLGVWTTCIRGGRIVLTHGAGNILGMSTSLQIILETVSSHDLWI
jgi:hypothetical protein